MDQTPHKRFLSISKAVANGKFSELGDVQMTEDSNLEVIKMKVIPRQGVHAEKEYTLIIQFREEGAWPKIIVDSPIFNPIKTPQLKKNIGFGGAEHKGICIKNLSYGYPFYINFNQLCGNRWDVYICLLISTFNNIQDFQKGNGFRSNYKQILSI